MIDNQSADFVNDCSASLEKELSIMFGNNLRSLGGEGVLKMESYLNSMAKKYGRRALVT
jgi:hypothetical protein